MNYFLAKTRVTQINQFTTVVLLSYCMHGVKYIIRNGKTSSPSRCESFSDTPSERSRQRLLVGRYNKIYIKGQ